MRPIILLLLVGLLGFASCNKQAQTKERNGDFELQLLFEKDGCKMYRFYDARWVYWSNCRGSIEYSYRSGKSTKYNQTVIDQ